MPSEDAEATESETVSPEQAAEVYLAEHDAPSTGNEAETPGPIKANAAVIEYPLEDKTNSEVSIDANEAITETPKEESKA